MAREGSKRQIAIEIMSENGDKPMADVLPLIAEANGITVAAAKSYYVWIVKNTDTPGKVETVARTAKVKAKKVAKAPKQPKKDKLVEAAKREGREYAKKKAEKPVETKSPEEIERIKAANLARMKEVAARVKKLDKQNDDLSPRNEEQEKDIVAPVTPDSFEAPAFLTQREVELLV
jgi:hypothetical protein